MKTWSVLENKKQYDEALERINELMDLNPGLKTDSGREMKLLLLLIEKY